MDETKENAALPTDLINHFVPAKTNYEKDFHLLAQGPASNSLAKNLTKKITSPTQFDIYGTGSIENSDFRLFIRGYQELVNGVNQSAAMLLDCLMIAATQNGLQNTLVKLPLKEYMSMRGLKDEKEIRTQVKRDIDALERISFEYKGIGKHRGDWLNVTLAGGTSGIINSVIIFRFSNAFFDTFRVSETTRYLYMYFPREALLGNIKQHPHKFWLGQKISAHKRMNLGKPNEDIIGVDTLINYCPNMPTYEAVMQGSRHITQQIIEPFERDMDALNYSFSWYYTNRDDSPQDYQSFMSATVTIHWHNYPNIKKLKDRKAKRAIKQKTYKKKSK